MLNYFIDPISYQEVFFIFIGLYCSTALYCFATWFKRFRQDHSLSASDKQLCLKVLAVATICWPIVLPLAYLEKQLLCSPVEGVFWR